MPDDTERMLEAWGRRQCAGGEKAAPEEFLARVGKTRVRRRAAAAGAAVVMLAAGVLTTGVLTSGGGARTPGETTPTIAEAETGSADQSDRDCRPTLLSLTRTNLQAGDADLELCASWSLGWAPTTPALR